MNPKVEKRFIILMSLLSLFFGAVIGFAFYHSGYNTGQATSLPPLTSNLGTQNQPPKPQVNPCADGGYVRYYEPVSMDPENRYYLGDPQNNWACCPNRNDCEARPHIPPYRNCYEINTPDSYQDIEHLDEKADAYCTAQGQWADLDGMNAQCQAKGYNWNVGRGNCQGDASAGWTCTSTCCGDDPNEYYVQNAGGSPACCIGPGASDCEGCGDEYNRFYERSTDNMSSPYFVEFTQSSNACCDSQNHCVFNNRCYPNYGGYSYENIDHSSDVKNDAYCNNEAKWSDLDGKNVRCQEAGYYWNIGRGNCNGDSGSGWDCKNTCCGDDPNEYYVQNFEGSPACCAGPNATDCNSCPSQTYYREYEQVSDQSGDKYYIDYTEETSSCCKTSTNCVFHSHCYYLNDALGYEDIEHVDGKADAYCAAQGQWADLDGMNAQCQAKGYNWNVGRGNCRGDNGTGWDCTNTCCGDDSGEFYISNFQGSPACCAGASGSQCLDCGDGVCSSLETPANCQADCGFCGNGLCNMRFETAESCPQDCLCGPNDIGKCRDNILNCLGGSMEYDPVCQGQEGFCCVANENKIQCCVEGAFCGICTDGCSYKEGACSANCGSWECKTSSSICSAVCPEGYTCGCHDNDQQQDCLNDGGTWVANSQCQANYEGWSCCPHEQGCCVIEGSGAANSCGQNHEGSCDIELVCMLGGGEPIPDTYGDCDDPYICCFHPSN